MWARKNLKRLFLMCLLASSAHTTLDDTSSDLQQQKVNENFEFEYCTLYVMTYCHIVIYICMICDIEFGVMAPQEHSSNCCHVCACASGIKQTADTSCTMSRQQTTDRQARLLNQGNWNLTTETSKDLCNGNKQQQIAKKTAVWVPDRSERHFISLLFPLFHNYS